jgi:hypothetical protein
MRWLAKPRCLDGAPSRSGLPRPTREPDFDRLRTTLKKALPPVIATSDGKLVNVNFRDGTQMGIR